MNIDNTINQPISGAKSFEDCWPTIEPALKKKSYKWRLKAISWFDYEDVKQIIATHIFKKWHLWDQKRPLEPWLDRVIGNQIRNLVRNHYSSCVRPCISCPFNNSASRLHKDAVYSECGFTKDGKQSSECPLYAKWERTKKKVFDLKLSVSLENHKQQDTLDNSSYADFPKAEQRLHNEMKKRLSDKNFFIYKMFFIDCLSDTEIIKILKFKTNEKNRTAGYKQMQNIKNAFRKKAEEILKDTDIFEG
jgi:hypothetical protein